MPKGISKQVDADGNPIRVSRAADRRAARPAIIDPNQSYSIIEVAASCDCSPAVTKKEIRSGELASYLDGKRRKVLGANIIARNRRRAGLQP